MKSYPNDIQQLVDHFLQKFDGRVLLDSGEAAKVLDRTPGSLAVDRSKKTGPGYLKQGRAVKYNLYSLADYLQSRKVHAGQQEAA